VAWRSLVLHPVGRIVIHLSMGMLKLLGLKKEESLLKRYPKIIILLSFFFCFFMDAL